jgi:serine/threonine protein kinase
MIARNGYGKGVDFWALGCLTYEMLTSDPPFVVKNSNYKELEKKILSEKIVYPSFLSANTHALLKGMLERDT